MTHYIHTDAPDRPRALPRAWRNVSGLHLLPAADLAALGWLPWTDAPRPDHDAIHERLAAAVEITATEARRVWTIERRPAEEIPAVADAAAAAVARVKSGCGQVIEARYPLWKQANLMARAIELLDIRRDRVLTATEAAERDMIEAARDWIARQRAESDRLEAVVAAIVGGSDDDDAKRRALAGVAFAEAP